MDCETDNEEYFKYDSSKVIFGVYATDSVEVSVYSGSTQIVFYKGGSSDNIKNYYFKNDEIADSVRVCFISEKGMQIEQKIPVDKDRYKIILDAQLVGKQLNCGITHYCSYILEEQ